MWESGSHHTRHCCKSERIDGIAGRQLSRFRSRGHRGRGGGGYRAQVPVRISADGGVIGIETDVPEVVETRKETHPGEHADPGDEDEADVPGTALDDAVEAPQVVPVGGGHFGIVDDVEDCRIRRSVPPLADQ